MKPGLLIASILCLGIACMLTGLRKSGDLDTGDVFSAINLLAFMPLVGYLVSRVIPRYRKRSRRRREQRGLCPICSYDLRATPGQCPECGTIYPPLRSMRE